MGVRVWRQLKMCDLELVEKVEKIRCNGEPKSRLKVLGTNGHKAGWGVGRMGVLSRDIHLTVRWEAELSSASHHFMELGFRGESLKNLSPLAPFNDLHKLKARSLDILCLHHEAIFKVRGIALSYDMVIALLTRVPLDEIKPLQRKKRTVRP